MKQSLYPSNFRILAIKQGEFRNNEFTYEIVGELDNHFYITTEENQNGKDGRIGVLRIKNVGF